MVVGGGDNTPAIIGRVLTVVGGKVGQPAPENALEQLKALEQMKAKVRNGTGAFIDYNVAEGEIANKFQMLHINVAGPGVLTAGGEILARGQNIHTESYARNQRSPGFEWASTNLDVEEGKATAEMLATTFRNGTFASQKFQSQGTGMYFRTESFIFR